jgi:hypothetical protein
VEQDGIRRVLERSTLKANLKDKKQIFGLICLKHEDSSILYKNIQKNLRNVNSKGFKSTLENAVRF